MNITSVAQAAETMVREVLKRKWPLHRYTVMLMASVPRLDMEWRDGRFKLLLREAG